MPVRSLTSSVIRWPDRGSVLEAVRAWSADVRRRAEVVRVGCFGSLVRGDWGVGSDADLVVIVEASADPFYRRRIGYDASALPVPADLLVYTEAEWGEMTAGGRQPLGPVEWIEPR